MFITSIVYMHYIIYFKEYTTNFKRNLCLFKILVQITFLYHSMLISTHICSPKFSIFAIVATYFLVRKSWSTTTISSIAHQGSIPHLSHQVGLIGYATIAKQEGIKVTWIYVLSCSARNVFLSMPKAFSTIDWAHLCFLL